MRIYTKKKYAVYDSLGNILKSFNSYQAAFTFKIMNQRYDWKNKRNVIMRYFVKNISDVITNSSSEVFVMKPMDAEYYRNIEGNTNTHIWTTKITEDWLLNDAMIECPELVYSILGIDEADVLKAFQDEYYYTPKENDIPSEKLWLCFLDSYRKDISEKLLGNYIVEIDDNFDGFLNLYKQATKDSIYTSYSNY